MEIPSMLSIMTKMGIIAGICMIYPLHKFFSSDQANKLQSALFAFTFSMITSSTFRFIASCMVERNIRYIAIAASWYICIPLAILLNHKRGRKYIEGAARGIILFIVVMFILIFALTYFI
jgi:hypothetical protein